MPNVTIPEEKDGRGNKSQGWLQSEKESHVKMWQLGVKHPTALVVLHFMISKLNRGANGIVISAPALARQIGISERTARAATVVLSEARFVQVLKSGNTNVYIVNSKVAWQGNRGMRFSAFNAQLIVDEQEQIKTIEELQQEGAELIEVPIMTMELDIEAISGKTVEAENPQKNLL